MITPFCHRIAAALLFAAALPASAASFDCAKAKTDVEKAVCADPQLSDLDVQLAAAWRSMLNAVKDPAALRLKQREWAEGRSSCSEGEMQSCLADSYSARIKLLHEMEAALHDAPSRGSGKPDPTGFRLLVKRLADESAVLYIFRKGDSKPWQALPVLQLPSDLDIEPRIEKFNASVLILALYNGRGGLHGSASYDYYVSLKGGPFSYSDEITKLADNTLSGVEFFSGEIETVSSDGSPTRGTNTRYTLVDGKPQILRREIFDGESDKKFDFTTYETYRDGKLVKRWTKKERR